MFALITSLLVMKGHHTAGHLAKDKSFHGHHAHGHGHHGHGHGHATHAKSHATHKPSGIKSDVDFATAVENGKTIKDKINKLFHEKFSDERMAEQEAYSKQILNAVTPGTRKSQYSFNSNTSEDEELFAR